MPFNVPGLLVPLQLLFSPRLVLPGLTVRDIRQLDFVAMRKVGYRAVVFDKDNCLTLPHKDTLIPELSEAWGQCLQTFGPGNVLIVSNSAGTRLDAGGIQAESVAHHLRAPVLRHTSLKPSYSCIASIGRYFSSLNSPLEDSELIIIGDRIFTDVVMANRMNRRPSLLTMFYECAFESAGSPGKEKGEQKGRGPLAIWTTGVWERESMVMRWCEKRLVRIVERWDNSRSSTGEPDARKETASRFVREVVEPNPVNEKGMLGRWWSSLRD